MEVGSPFGSRTRTRVLLVLGRRGESYARELSRLLAAPLSVVQKALASLDEDGLIESRMIGRTRLFKLHRGYFALGQLQGFLARLLEADEGLRARTATRRPGRTRQARKASADRNMGESRPRPSDGHERTGDTPPAGRGGEWKVW